ncbi:hypothetical protein J31TS4_36940 [Paenibacillus sp. J31TS4]|nr:hypothetical protein J31TS4_36940 [Paenibacillus sp. J31TS4]
MAGCCPSTSGGSGTRRREGVFGAAAAMEGETGGIQAGKKAANGIQMRLNL